MAKLPILEVPQAILRKGTKEIALREIPSPQIRKLIRDMSETLAATELGIGIAAPQVGKSLRIFLISEEAMLKKPPEQDPLNEDAGKEESSKPKNLRYLVFINPELKKVSKKKKLLTEGCLSVNDPKGELLYGKIKRAEKVTIHAYDENGKKFIRGASGLLAQVIQHEMDHLKGVLFIDKAEKILVKKVAQETESKPPRH